MRCFQRVIRKGAREAVLHGWCCRCRREAIWCSVEESIVGVCEELEELRILHLNLTMHHIERILLASYRLRVAIESVWVFGSVCGSFSFCVCSLVLMIMIVLFDWPPIRELFHKCEMESKPRTCKPSFRCSFLYFLFSHKDLLS